MNTDMSKSEECAANEVLRQMGGDVLEAALVAKAVLEAGRGRAKRAVECIYAGVETLRARERTVTFERAVGEALVGAWFEGQRHYASGCNLQQAAWADVYFAGQQPEHPLPPRARRGRLPHRLCRRRGEKAVAPSPRMPRISPRAGAGIS